MWQRWLGIRRFLVLSNKVSFTLLQDLGSKTKLKIFWPYLDIWQLYSDTNLNSLSVSTKLKTLVPECHLPYFEESILKRTDKTMSLPPCPFINETRTPPSTSRGLIHSKSADYVRKVPLL